MADEPKNPLRTVGSALEGLAKRVGALVAEVSETVTLSEANRKLITAAREHRAEGRPQQALETLAGLEGIDALEDAVLQGSVCLSLAHLALLGQVPPEPEWLAGRPKGDARIGTHELAASAILLSQGKADKALDELRRAFRGAGKVAVQERDEFTFLAHLVGLQGYAALGDRERAIREAHKARSSVLDTADARLLRIVRTSGFGLLLEDDQLEALPGMVFAKGFLRCCARTLGLDEDTVLGLLYERERETRATQREGSAPLVVPSPRTPSTDSGAKPDIGFNFEEWREWLREVPARFVSPRVLLWILVALFVVLVVYLAFTVASGQGLPPART